MDLLDQDIEMLATHDVLTIEQNETIGFSILTMIRNRLRRLPVVDGEKKLVGIITSTDILNALEEINSNEFLQRKVEEFMTKDVIYVDQNTSIGAVLVTMDHSEVSCVPIIKDKVITGIFTHKDLLLTNVLWREVPNLSVSNEEAPGHEIEDDDWIEERSTIRDTVNQLVKTRKKHLLVRDAEGEIVGAISVKNILRTMVSYLILQTTHIDDLFKVSLTNVVTDPLMRQRETSTISDIRNWMIARSTEIVPLINEDGKITTIVNELEMISFLIDNLNLTAYDAVSS